MRAIIFVNGVVENRAALANLVTDDDYLIGVDGGTLHCLDINRLPRVVVGDLDSLPADVCRELRYQKVQFESHQPEKNQTDLELAVERAIADGATSIMLVGALGGRLDQMLANLLLLAQRDWPLPICVVDAHQMAQIVRPGKPLSLHGSVGMTVSALPLTPPGNGYYLLWIKISAS